MLPKDTVAVNVSADGQKIAAGELKLLIFWLQDATCGHPPIQPQGCSVVKKSRPLYDLNLNHRVLYTFSASSLDVQMCVSA